jgi:excisionase family DNA binding protein
MASLVAISEPLLDVKEVAQFLRCSTDCVRKMARKGIIPCRKVGVVGTLYRFRRSDIEAWLNEQNQK